MIKLYRYLKDLLFLYRVNKDISLIKRNHYDFISTVFSFSRQKRYKRKFIRELLCSIIKQLRIISPYQIQNYKEAELLYKEYFTLENHIPSFEHLKKLVRKQDVWIIQFRGDYPVKGDKYFSSYFINRTYSDREQYYAFKLGGYKSKYGRLYAEGEEYNSISLDEITQFKFATKEEIKIAQKRIKDKEKLQKQIDLKQEELSELYSKKSKI